MSRKLSRTPKHIQARSLREARRLRKGMRKRSGVTGTHVETIDGQNPGADNSTKQVRRALKSQRRSHFGGYKK